MEGAAKSDIIAEQLVSARDVHRRQLSECS